MTTLAAQPEDIPRFLTAAGELGGLIWSHDWSATPLGPIAAWPDSLKAIISLMLNSPQPMWLGWGTDVTFLYNDAYIDVLSRSKHPWALGRPMVEVWAEIWDVCEPMVNRVYQDGEAIMRDDMRLFMRRGEMLEEVFYAFSYSPVRDESGNVAGLFCPNLDVTSRHLNARRLRNLKRLRRRRVASHDGGEEVQAFHVLVLGQRQSVTVLGHFLVQLKLPLEFVQAGLGVGASQANLDQLNIGGLDRSAALSHQNFRPPAGPRR